MKSEFLIKILEEIKTEIVKKRLASAWGRCDVLIELIKEEEMEE